MDDVAKLVEAVWQSDVALAFVTAIGGFWLIAMWRHAFGSPEHVASIDRSAPTLLTTLGVLGTFTGIFIGLIDFNVDAIDDSVPQLLAGLKIAFSTSIVGMGAAILFKVGQSLIPRSFDVGDVGPVQIHRVLSDIRTASQQQRQAISDVRQAIAGDDETSLVTQLQKLRTTILDGDRDSRDLIDRRFQQQIDEFRKFADAMVKNGTQALIEALENVIRDFNTRISEQFGENFKHLNQAVGALLEWQERYRDHIEKIQARFEATVLAVERSEEALGRIAEHTAKIPETMRSLHDLITNLHGLVSSMDKHLDALAALRDKAVEAFPVIEDNLRKFTETLNAHGQAIETIQRETQRMIRDSLQKTAEAIEKEIQALDDQMQREVTRVIETMGRGLASLSEKFVNDYAPLTDRLREIVNVGRSV